VKYLEELVKLAELLQLEKQHELDAFNRAVKEKSIHERKHSGKCLFPLNVDKTAYGISGLLEIHLEADLKTDVTHFNVGSIVNLFSSADSIKSKSLVSGTVSYSKANKLVVQIRSEEEPEELHETTIGADMSVDNKTYRILEHTLNYFINSEDSNIKNILRKIWGDEYCNELKPSSNITIPALNEWQNQAVNSVLQSEDFMVIHGPPGTGKTTTLVQAIKQIVKTEKQTLVCANSNAAVDHLVKCLVSEGLSTVRLGNIARVDEDVLENQLDFKIQKEVEYKLVKDLKKRAQDTKNRAQKFKRSFNAEDRQNRKMWYREARTLRKEAQETEAFLIEKVIRNSQVVCTTLAGSDHEMLRDFRFKTAFVDEAGQALAPAALTPFKRSEKLVLAGDPFQLPPLVKNNEAAKKGLDISLIELIMKSTENRTVKLKTQYRMDEKIQAFSNSQFYKKELVAHESVKNHGKDLDSFLPLEFIDTAGCNYEESFPLNGKSLCNLEEANLVSKRLNELQEIAPNLSVGVISPYRGQVNVLSGITSELDVQVNTIDAFQGREKDIIIVSLVRSNEEGSIGFLTDYRRMNVAMTRARKKLILIGDSATIGNDKFYSEFLEFVETDGSYRSAWEYM